MSRGDQQWWDTAQVCVNGHVIVSDLGPGDAPKQKRCDKRGEDTITACPRCNTPIRGDHLPDVVPFYDYTPPKYCHECGEPYPWTSRRLHAARDLALELDTLTQEERQLLAGSINDILSDTPQTQVATFRLKRLAAKAGKGAADALRSILIDVASETAKKAIWGV